MTPPPVAGLAALCFALALGACAPSASPAPFRDSGSLPVAQLTCADLLQVSDTCLGRADFQPTRENPAQVYRATPTHAVAVGTRRIQAGTCVVAFARDPSLAQPGAERLYEGYYRRANSDDVAVYPELFRRCSLDGFVLEVTPFTLVDPAAL